MQRKDMIAKMNKKSILSQTALNIIFILIVIFTIAPFLLLVSSSFTDEQILTQYGYNFLPKKFSLDSYIYLFKSSDKIFRAYGITIFVTVFGTIISLLVTTLFAYPLSRKEFPLRKALSFIVFFTMLFNGGLVPTYLMWTQTFHIKDTIWALIIPGHIMNAFYVIMIRSYITSNIPDELIEAARIDGATEISCLKNIILPLAKPIMATMALMIGLSYWNDWVNCLYYVTDQQLFSIQAVLNTIITNIQYLQSNANLVGDSSVFASLPSVSIRMAIAVVGVVPVLVIYPFFQKYFVKGIVVGGVKG